MSLVRLKRGLDEEPADALLIAYKKKKENLNETSVFEFATTLLDEKEDVFQHISKVISIVNSKQLYKQKEITNITEKLRKDNKLYSKNSRLKLLNCLRGTVDSACDDELKTNEFTLLNVESEKVKQAANAEEEAKESKKYLYDIYYAPQTLSDFDILNQGSEISCHIIDSEMAFESFRDDAYGEDEFEEDEDDSNDENNWRNDYPDEEEGDSIGEEDMKLAASCRDLNLDSDNELSSDEDDEGLIHSVDVFSEDVASYGVGYANYKKKIKKQNLFMDSDDNVDDDDDDEGNGYYDYISSSDSEKSNL